MTPNDNLLKLILMGIVELFNQLNENLKMSLTNSSFKELTMFLKLKL